VRVRRHAGLLLLLLLGCAPGDGRPDLLLVTVDTLRADALACYGGPPDVGPALCSLGERGVLYEWAISAAPSTAPSVASLLTSLYPAEHGVTQFAMSWLDESAVTLAELLAASGYATGAVVSNPVLDRSRQLGQGFETYDVRMTRHELNRPQLAEREARATTDAALAWLARARPPRFLWVHYQDPHGPYDPPGAAPPAAANQGRVLPVLPNHSGKGGIPAYQVLPGVRGLDAYTERYRAEIRYLDGELARLLVALPDAGVLLTADHGEAFGEDDYYLAHGHSLGLEQIRVPLLWRPPGGVAPRRVGVPVGGVDVAPTLLAAAGLPAAPQFEGRALPLSDEEAPRDRVLFAEHRARGAVVAGRRYYARDRATLGRGRRDRISGGVLEPLPTRAAWLRGTELPPYEVVAPADTASLDRALRSHLKRARGKKGGQRELPEETRQQLRALGYLE
jgi:arylsulfatase A-like enzyme